MCCTPVRARTELVSVPVAALSYRSVSMVPPAYYAQLAAARGRLIATGRELLDVSTGATGAGSSGAEADEIAPGLGFDVRVNARLGGSMYYV